MITCDGRVDHRADDSGASAADDKSVLLTVILVLIVDDEPLTSEVVGLSLSSSAVFGLIALGVSFVLHNLHVCHESRSI